jgi:hypothetical protein
MLELGGVESCHFLRSRLLSHYYANRLSFQAFSSLSTRYWSYFGHLLRDALRRAPQRLVDVSDRETIQARNIPVACEPEVESGRFHEEAGGL